MTCSDREGSLIAWLEQVSNTDVPLVGGKNASLGEMMQTLGKEGVRVPSGFALTANAYREFLAFNDLQPVIKQHLMAFSSDQNSLPQV
ncbi:MAG: PEP/pyruvate-binding domain-containing protein, partial [Porticoccus sp.]